MPFTPSHMAAVLPFLRTPLVPAALAIGAMAPDFPYYYLPRGIPRDLTHSLLGLVTIDLGMTLAGLAVWWLLLREPVVDLLPAPVRERIPPRPPSAWRGGRRSAAAAVALIVVSALVGSATHLAWDAFTHPGWLVDWAAILRVQVGPLPVDKWLQHASTVLGIAVLAAWAVVRLRRAPRDPARPTRLAPGQRALGLALIAAAVLLGGGIPWIAGLVRGFAPLDPALLFLVASVLVAAGSAMTVLAAVAWHLLRRGA